MSQDTGNDLATNAAAAAALLKVMSNPNRLMILCALEDSELAVHELNQKVPLSQSALSQHLAALREADLVSTRREAQTIYYLIKGNAARRVIALLRELFCP